MKVDRSKATLAASIGGVLVGGAVVGVLMLSGTGNASPSPSESVTPAAATTSDTPATTVAPAATPTTKAVTPPAAVTSTSPVVSHSSVTVEAPKAKVQPQVQQKETTPVTETTPAEQPKSRNDETFVPTTAAVNPPDNWTSAKANPCKLGRDGLPNPGVPGC